MSDMLHNLAAAIGRFIRFIGRQLRRLGVWWWTKFQASERNGKIALVLVPLLSVCCLSVLFIPSGVEPTPTPTAVASTATEGRRSATDAIAQETAVPTATYTATAVPPTRTPEPTVTAVPTRTPRPTDTPTPEAPEGYTAEESEYISAVSEISLSYSEALNALALLLTAAGDDPGLVLDEEWRIQTVAATLLLNFNGEQVRAMEPPARFVTLHSHLLDAADEYDTSATLLLEGIDEGSVTKIDGAVAAMLAGNEAINRATAEASNIQAAAAAPTSAPATAVPTNPPAQPTAPPATAVPTQPAAPTTPPEPTAPPPPSSAQVQITAVNKRDEYVDIQNTGGSDIDLGGWVLLSEKGAQSCGLGGVLPAGATLRIYALAEHSHLGGFNCGFGGPIWNNSEPDPAVLLDQTGAEVSRR